MTKVGNFLRDHLGIVCITAFLGGFGIALLLIKWFYSEDILDRFLGIVGVLFMATLGVAVQEWRQQRKDHKELYERIFDDVTVIATVYHKLAELIASETRPIPKMAGVEKPDHRDIRMRLAKAGLTNVSLALYDCYQLTGKYIEVGQYNSETELIDRLKLVKQILIITSWTGEVLINRNPRDIRNYGRIT